MKRENKRRLKKPKHNEHKQCPVCDCITAEWIQIWEPQSKRWMRQCGVCGVVHVKEFLKAG